MRTLNRAAAVATVALVLGFTALAAKATPPKHRTAAVVVTRATTSTVSPATAGHDRTRTTVRHEKRWRHRRDDDGRANDTSSRSLSSAGSAPVAPAPAPAPTVQASIVTSGGS